MKKVAIVLLNWNGRAYLECFLPSVIKHSSAYSIIVADNNSTDDSVAFLKEHYPSVHCLQLTNNEGYSKGYNTALHQVEAEYYILVNSDVEVTEQWVEPMIALMDSDPSIAACQPKVLDFNQRDSFEYAGAAGGFVDYLGYPFCRGRLFSTLEKDTLQYDDVKEIFWATGACLVVRSDAFHKVGGFDEDFFAHLEEIDLCWRLKALGYKIMYCGKSSVYHVGGGTLNKLNPRKTYLNFRNSLFMLYKNLPTASLVYLIGLRLVLDGIAGIKFLVEGNGKHTWAVVRAHFSFYAKLPLFYKKRQLQKQHSLDFPEVYKSSVVLDYFIKRKHSIPL